MSMPELNIRELFYITHINNLSSIMSLGIYSHEKIETDDVHSTPIYDTDIVSRRKEKTTPGGRNLWSYANLYFQPRNAMMYRVVHEKDPTNLAVVGIKTTILNENGIFITDGNAAHDSTLFYPPNKGMDILRKQWSIIQNDWWNRDDGSKRKIMAECLIPNQVKPDYIQAVYVAKNSTREKAQSILGDSNIPISTQPDMFFQPNSRTKIGANISLIDGDMFFSNLQTLTISVNLQGVMGKGLASRAKYQFPDVYVAYQDACRSKRITATRPFLYKRESSLDDELADLETPLGTSNTVKWFLLFATKRHWKDNSRMEDIEGGLKWVRDNYQKQGIQSLALPALGCGLGGLDWKTVGPLMCKFLHGIDISVAIYLPQESQIEDIYKTESHLLP
ncbi:DUF4433 domain-containing protein [Candidatus Poribacteria bacterium]|nr:MAG: DUF4433 domain-containing protein [Candidatus Poribacteria bacterium]